MNFVTSIGIATEFTKKYHSHAQLISVIRTKNIIELDYDIGFLVETIFRVTIDTETQKIIEVITVK